jgi:hypothetical protein
MRTYFLAIFCTIYIGAFCQKDTVFIKRHGHNLGDNTYKIDTLIFSSELPTHYVLCGTMKIPRYDWIGECGLYFNTVESTPCNHQIGEGDSILKDEISVITLTDSTLNIEANIHDNCCFSFLCDAKEENDSILNLTYIGYGVNCSCDCCFGLTYKFNITKGFPKNCNYLKGVELNSDRKTLKLFNYKTK